MDNYKDGEDRQSILNLAYTLLLQLKSMPSLDLPVYPDWKQLSRLLREWLEIHGTTPQIQVGADYTSLNGAVPEQLSIEILKVMQQNVLTHIKENGFPEKDQAFVVSAEVPLTTKDAMRLTIKLRTEKVSSG